MLTGDVMAQQLGVCAASAATIHQLGRQVDKACWRITRTATTAALVRVAPRWSQLIRGAGGRYGAAVAGLPGSSPLNQPHEAHEVQCCCS